MITLPKYLVVFAVLIVVQLNAQNFQGVATYKTKRQVDIKLDSTKVNSEMQKQIVEMMKKQFEKTYKLSFNKEESIYKEEEGLNKPQPSGGHFVMVTSGSDGSDMMYKNTKEERFVSQNEMFGKVFLIKDNLKKQDWQLGSETKNIGNYTCYKATMKREIEVSNSISVNDETKQNAVTKEEITITAWYTPQIPVNNGPATYWGLPGLILEINDESQTIICSKIVINPANKLKIEAPKKGKVVTQEEFDKIMDKKVKEMNERYNGRGNGESMSIQIRG